MKCPRKDCDNVAEHSQTYGVLPCKVCQQEDTRARLRGGFRTETIRQSDRLQRQRDKHGADLLQPYVGDKVNRDFFEKYPDQVDTYGVRKDLEKS